MVDGFLLIDKPAHLTSFQVCQQLRQKLQVHRIGHTGTLDPFATGLLVVAIGLATKLINEFSDTEKTYQVTIELGKTSQTLDPDSPIEDVWNGHRPTLSEIEELVKVKFSGEIMQAPPAISAVKINGKRSYYLARSGLEPQPAARPVHIYQLTILNYNFPYLELEVTVSSGFYIRSLAHDLGTQLCGGAICTQLRRTKVHGFSVFQALSLDQVSPVSIRSITDVLHLPELPVTATESYRLKCGQKLRIDRSDPPQVQDGLTCLYLGTQCIGIGRVTQGVLSPAIMVDNNNGKNPRPELSKF